MTDKTKIEWTDSTWNPMTGCKKVSPGCKNCYAETIAERFRGIPGHPFEYGFDLTLRKDKLHLPEGWRQPRFVFVNSMSDLFLDGVESKYIKEIFQVMENASQHVYQILTKRPDRMVQFVNKRYKAERVPDHIWLGVSVEMDQYKNRINKLKEINSRRLFVSFEPLLGLIQFENNELNGVAWAIIGGESGHKARPMKEEWIESIYQAAKISKTKFFFKQWGAFDSDGKRVGKKNAGRLFRGQEWNAMPAR